MHTCEPRDVGFDCHNRYLRSPGSVGGCAWLCNAARTPERAVVDLNDILCTVTETEAFLEEKVLMRGHSNAYIRMGTHVFVGWVESVSTRAGITAVKNCASQRPSQARMRCDGPIEISTTNLSSAPGSKHFRCENRTLQIASLRNGPELLQSRGSVTNTPRDVNIYCPLF